jgi:hypothetical protein
MRRLTLILSDLYLPEEAPEEAVAAAVAPLELPGLTALLRIASKAPLPDWRAWLAAEIGSKVLAEIPVAQVAGRAFVSAHDASTAWLATPVHLSARLDHVRLVDRGLLNLAGDERAALCEDFARQFGPEYQLHSGKGREFLLTGIPACDAVTVDPARLLDTDIAPALARGKDALKLRRVGAEIEMWLHVSVVNESRERARAPRISALWLWGGGLPATASEGQVGTGEGHGKGKCDAVSLHGGDSFLAGLAHCAKLNSPTAAPAALSGLDHRVEHHLVELAPMCGAPQASLLELDESWFLPARAALDCGTLSVLDIVANDARFRVTPKARWRFWRPRRTWFENVAGHAQARKA